jgi:hypothetical protein
VANAKRVNVGSRLGPNTEVAYCNDEAAGRWDCTRWLVPPKASFDITPMATSRSGLAARTDEFPLSEMADIVRLQAT